MHSLDTASQRRDFDRDASPRRFTIRGSLRSSPGLLSGRSSHATHPASLRPGRAIHVSAFGRFDEILYLVEKTSDLTLPIVWDREGGSIGAIRSCNPLMTLWGVIILSWTHEES